MISDALGDLGAAIAAGVQLFRERKKTYDESSIIKGEALLL